MASGTGAPPRVVVGVDGSAESVDALRWAAGYAAATGATIDVVLSWHFPAAAGVVPPGVAPQAISDEVRATMQDALDKALIAVFGGRTPPNVQAQVTYGHPAVVLVDASAAADLLVVGNRGNGAFTGMLTGSVSMHCVNNARCPVVVVRGAE